MCRTQGFVVRIFQRTKRLSLIADHNFIIGSRSILRHCWPVVGALMLATFADAQSLSPVGLDSRMSETVEFNVDGTCGMVGAQAQETPYPPVVASDVTETPWEFSLTATGYIIPRGPSYISPDFSADRGKLHLEGRYNNEALRTGSVWAGYNFTAGKKLVLNVTPMIGGVFGSLNGIAPGYVFTLTYKRVQLYSNGEFVFDAQNRHGDFFYNWNQITYSPLKWLGVGIVSQRTRAYVTSLNIQRGVLVGFTYKKMNFTTNIFNLGWTAPSEVLSLGFNF